MDLDRKPVERSGPEWNEFSQFESHASIHWTGLVRGSSTRRIRPMSKATLLIVALVLGAAAGYALRSAWRPNTTSSPDTASSAQVSGQDAVERARAILKQSDPLVRIRDLS